MIVHDLIILSVMVVALLFLVEQIGPAPVTFASPFRQRVRAGLLAGGIGLLMMGYDLQIHGVSLVFYHVPLLVAGIYSGAVSIAAAGLMLIGGRFILYGLSAAAIIPGFVVLLLCAVCMAVVKQTARLRQRWFYAATAASMLIGFGVYIGIGRETHHTAVMDALFFVGVNYMISGLAAYVVYYIRQHKSYYEQAQLKNAQLQGQQQELAQSRQEIYDVLESITDAFYALDREWRFVYVNQAAQELLFSGQPKLVGECAWELYPQLIGGELYEKYHQVMNRRETLQFEYDVPSIGHCFYIRVYPSETGISVYHQDITVQRHAQQQLKEAQQRYQAVLEQIQEVIFQTDAQGNWTFLNPAWTHITGYSVAESMHTHCLQFLYPEDREKNWCRMSEQVQRGERNYHYTTRYITKDGTVRWLEVFSQFAYDAAGKLKGTSGTIIDITERKKAEEALVEMNQRLQELSLRDGLTGVYNRRHFDEVLAQEWRRACRSRQPLSLILFDIDHFKLFNDHYGHQAGDECLREVAAAMNSKLQRAADMGARYGGEEFVVVLPETDEAGACFVAESIRREIEALGIAHARSQVSLFVTGSFGVATLVPEPEGDPAVLVAHADQALYQAKRSGRNQVIAYTDNEAVAASVTDTSAPYAFIQEYIDTLHAKDSNTWEHSNLVAHYALLLASQLGLDEVQREHIFLAALLHDIGKLDIPDSILKKPERLTEREFAVIQQHPLLGFEKLMRHELLRVNQYVLDGVLHHHERWDGTGYPLRLKGADIPYIARLLGVVDAFAAMTENRVYKRGMSVEEALEEIRRNRGHQFDPELTDVFLSLFPQQVKEAVR